MPGTSVYETTFSEIEPRLRAQGPAWLHELRRSGLDRFRELGFPSLREEEWRFTRTRPISELDFKPAPEARMIEPSRIAELAFNDEACVRVLVLNGRVHRDSEAKLPKGVRIESLTRALSDSGDGLRSLLASGIDLNHQRFAALNTAFLSDGVAIVVPDGVELEQPVHVVHVTVPDGSPFMTHPRLVVSVGRSARLALIESHVATGEGVYFTNAVSEIRCGENASFSHVKVQRESSRAFHIAIQHADIARSARFSTLGVSMGGALVRNDVHTILNGEGIDARVDGLYVAGARQHVDNHTFIRHAQPHCHSFELYKGVLDGQARGVFNGSIYVDPVAQKTDAKQENNCILISDNARINSNPRLEIFADDVKCTHGAAIGKTDADALFYLRSRGVLEKDARDLLVYAFASEVLERIETEPLKLKLEDDLYSWLEQARATRDAA